MDLDVIIVPDFAGPQKGRFELGTSLFLASWLQHKSQQSNSKLHVVCIGDPPAVVMRLSKLAKARLSVHETMEGEDRFRNKLIGLRIQPSASHFLLLDAADTVLFRPIRDIAAMLPSNSVGVTPANGVHLSLTQWKIVYDRLGIPMPSERAAVVGAAFDERFRASNPWFREFNCTLPYFNSGVVSAPWSFGLGPIWEKLVYDVPRILRDDDRLQRPIQPFAYYDQPPLAIATEILQQRGRSRSILADSMNTRWQHLYLGLEKKENIASAHAIGIFRNYRSTPDSTLSEDILKGIGNYEVYIRNMMKRRNLTPSLSKQARLTEYAKFLCDYLAELHANWIVVS